MTDYNDLALRLEGLISGVPHTVANYANAAALIYFGLDKLNWAGFYFVEGEKLVLGPFCGRPACIEIPMGHGVCGAAASEDKTLVVPNVREFHGHISCDCASNSEIVIPLHKDGRVFGVLDIDSPELARFADDDRQGLEALALIIEKNCSQQSEAE